MKLPDPEKSNLRPKPKIEDSVSKYVEQLSPTVKENDPPHFLDNADRLDPSSFPDQPRNGTTNTPQTMRNGMHLVNSYGITVRYNTISKKVVITIPGHTGSPDNADSISLTIICSLASLNGMSTSAIPSLLEAIGDRNLYNPVTNWIQSKAWDGVDRLESFYATLVHRNDYPEALKKILIRCWLISLVAAAFMPSGFHARGVLTLQGPQSIGKTSWIRNLISDAILASNVIKLDHHLDAGNKDSLITAITHWIVEIGELDSSFKKDVARLKGFLTAGSDKLRRPYGRTNAEYQRRTVFCATVNDENFLVDATGNSRFWTIPVTAINYQHDIDMQQLFAQVTTYFNQGESWWLSSEQEALLEQHNANHRTVSSMRERIHEALDLSRIDEPGLKAITATELLLEIDIRHPSQGQFKECHAILRELLGPSKKINGSQKWRIPIKKHSWTPLGQSKKAEFNEDDF
jgi:hypothetical protein